MTALHYIIILRLNRLRFIRSLQALVRATSVAVAPVEISAATAAAMVVVIVAEMEEDAVVDVAEEISRPSLKLRTTSREFVVNTFHTFNFFFYP